MTGSQRVALVVGGASGIGLATARRLAATHSVVVMADRDLREAHAQAAGLSEGGAHAVAAAVDVMESASVTALFDTIGREYGSLSTLVDTAGFVSPSPVADMSDAAWESVVSVHLGGTFRCARAAFPLLRKGDRPSMVATSSPAARMAITGRAAYSAAKAGIEALVRTLAIEWAPQGVRVNAVSPGYTLSPLLERLFSEGHADPDVMRSRVPLRFLAEPDDIAAVATFLASDDARYVTGQTITVDGGMQINGDGP